MDSSINVLNVLSQVSSFPDPDPMKTPNPCRDYIDYFCPVKNGISKILHNQAGKLSWDPFHFSRKSIARCNFWWKNDWEWFRLLRDVALQGWFWVLERGRARPPTRGVRVRVKCRKKGVKSLGDKDQKYLSDCQSLPITLSLFIFCFYFFFWRRWFQKSNLRSITMRTHSCWYAADRLFFSL